MTDVSIAADTGFRRPRTWTPAPDEDLSALVPLGKVTQQQYDDARELASRSHANTASVLLNRGLVTEIDLAEARGIAWGIEPIDLATEVFDADLVRRRSGREYIARGWTPVRRDADGRIIVATFHEPVPQLRQEVEEELGEPVIFRATGRWVLRQALLHLYADRVADLAANSLGAEDPLLSAQTVLSKPQKIGLVIIVVLYIIAVIIAPLQVIIWTVAAVSAAYLAATGFKYIVSLRGSRYDVVEQITVAEVEALDDDELPVFTVLVPVFREANIVAQLLGNLGVLDYPSHKLEVLILIEEEDDETREAITRANPPFNFHTITIPKGQPQTKPRACNVGLMVATGEFLVIYDAEDTPEPDQLKKAVVAFGKADQNLVCVQAALSFFNDAENALTRMFTLEYGFWFYYMLSGLDASRLPIPLGGTSNHFRVDGLRRLGGWDPYNVTEDADLGIRSSALGYRVGVINSTTMEEANTSIPNFIRQRSRWIKGYMQTSLVHARQPRKLIKEVGLIRFASFVLLIAGTPVTFLGVIPSYIVTIASIWLPGQTVADLVPWWVMWMMLFNFMIGNVIMVYVNMMGPFKRGLFYLVPWALLNPAYWVLHSIASYKALWQLITRPHYWEKTNHGLTTQTNQPGPSEVTADVQSAAAG